MSEERQRPIVVLDLDGTLVDSVYQHVVAWQAAFHGVGLQVSSAKVHRAIGMGGDRLVVQVAGEAAERAVGDAIREAHDRHFRGFIRDISELDGASDLIRELFDHGHRLVLATSTDGDMVDELLDRVDARAELSAVVAGSDVLHSMPAPDLIEAAIGRVGPGKAVVVGDAIWDAQAAAACGVPCIGLLSGGIEESRLREAGASWVYEGPRDLLRRLPDSPLGPQA